MTELAVVPAPDATEFAVSAGEATADWDCRTFGCVGVARVNRGRYAYLCDACRVRKVEEERAAADADPERRERREASERTAGDPEASPGLAAAVRALERPAKRLEKALGRRKVAKEEAKQALDEFNEAMRTIRERAERLL